MQERPSLLWRFKLFLDETDSDFILCDHHGFLAKKRAEVLGDIHDPVLLDVDQRDDKGVLLGVGPVFVEISAFHGGDGKGDVIVIADIFQDGFVFPDLESLLEIEGIVEAYVDLGFCHDGLLCRLKMLRLRYI